jgi:RimJ/RimL family protein N-acetyltransferase
MTRTSWPGPVLQSARVRLEPIVPERARALLSGSPDPDLAWEEGFPAAPLLDVLERVTADPDGPVRFGPYFAYVVIRRRDGVAVGDVGFHGPPNEAGDVEVGYALVPGARGAGLATESVALLVQWAFTQPAVRTVSARVDPGNAASVRVLERLGFAADGESGSHLRYAVSRPQG